jgi:peptidoglycan-N-acetylglucosamine deacetylase
MNLPWARKIVYIAAAIIIIILVVLYCYNWLTRYQLFGEYYRSVKTGQNVVALTFDDGPNPDITPRILALLKKYNAKATFFVLGKRVEKYPGLVRDEYLGGNEIGNHSWNHEKLLLKSYSFVKKEIESTDDAILKTGYKGKLFFRSPYGSRLFILPLYLLIHHRTHILWNTVMYDWEKDVPWMFDNFKKSVKPGAIVLMHDGYPGDYESRENTVKLLELILKEYSKKYRFVTVSELLESRSK